MGVTERHRGNWRNITRLHQEGSDQERADEERAAWQQELAGVGGCEGENRYRSAYPFRSAHDELIQKDYRGRSIEPGPAR